MPPFEAFFKFGDKWYLITSGLKLKGKSLLCTKSSTAVEIFLFMASTITPIWPSISLDNLSNTKTFMILRPDDFCVQALASASPLVCPNLCLALNFMMVASVEEFPRQGEDSASSLGFDAPVVAHSGSSVSCIVQVQLLLMDRSKAFWLFAWCWWWCFGECPLNVFELYNLYHWKIFDSHKRRQLKIWLGFKKT